MKTKSLLDTPISLESTRYRMLFFEGSCQVSFHYFHHIQILCTWAMVKTPRSHIILSLSFDAASAISPICDHPELGQVDVAVECRYRQKLNGNEMNKISIPCV